MTYLMTYCIMLHILTQYNIESVNQVYTESHNTSILHSNKQLDY